MQTQGIKDMKRSHQEAMELQKKTAQQSADTDAVDIFARLMKKVDDATQTLV